MGVPVQNICWVEEWTEGPGHSVLAVLGHSPLRVVLLGNTVLVYRGPDKEPLARMLRRHGQPGPGQASLARAGRYQDAWRGAEATPETGFVYANLGRLVELVGPGLPPNTAAALELIGLDAIDAAGMSSAWTGEGLRHTLYLHASARRGILATLRAQPGAEVYAAKQAPVDAAWALAARLDWAGLYESIPQLIDAYRNIAGSAPGGGKTYERWARGFTILNVPPADILRALGDDLVFLDGPDGVVAMFCRVRLKDWAEVATRMEAAAGFPFRTLPAANPAGAPLGVRYLNRVRGETLLLAPSYCELGRYSDPELGAVLVGTHPQAILGALARLRQPRLDASPDYGRVAAGMGGRYGLFLYTPARESYRQVYNTLLPALSAWQSTPFFPANPALLPPGSEILPCLFGTGLGLKVDDAGVTITVFSPVGIAGPVAWALDRLLLSNPAALGMVGAADWGAGAGASSASPPPPLERRAGGPPLIGE
jgi:hypothetical protein